MSNKWGGIRERELEDVFRWSFECLGAWHRGRVSITRRRPLSRYS
ncbi:Uncharacterized protein TCM_001847 [Theobroma cacao]|uniref:Uncharacterized protein n=1 Tax=Theobroma cacao TaxID=3641 RepID=A0A061DLM2_THECC|nr:Uncharacterized protein TCM_001847 [Theobroma cacao]